MISVTAVKGLDCVMDYVLGENKEEDGRGSSVML